MRETQQNKLADKGWHSMHKLLDREMPVPQKRRPVGWWWFGLLLLPLSIWGIQAWWISEHTPPIAPVQAIPTTERPIVQQKFDNQQVKTINTIPDATPGSLQNGKASAQELAAVSKLSVATKTITGTTMSPAPEKSAWNKRRETTPATTVQAAAVSSEQVLTTVAQEDAATSPIPESLPEENRVVTTIAKQSDLQALALPFQNVNRENIALFSAAPKMAAPASSSIVPRKTISPWAFGITASASTEHFSSVNALGAGLSADWHFARKWGLRSTLAYSRYRPSSDKQPVVAVEEVRYTNATGLYTGAYGNSSVGGSISSSNDLEKEYVYIPLRKLQQIEMPVSVFWQPTRSLRLYSGIVMNYTFMGQSAQQNYIDNNLVSLDSYATQRNASRVATNSLQRWKLHAQVGMGLGLGRHAELSAFWRAPISNIFSKLDGSLASYDSTTEQFQDVTITNTNIPSPSPRAGRFILQASWLF